MVVLCINITLDDILKLTQILFYLTAGVVAILTFISAKKGLLNTVNTEYHKRAFDKIEDLSQKLISEFDINSPNYWGHKDIIGKALKEPHERFLKRKDEILKSGEFPTSIPDNEDSSYLFNLVNRIKSDPFIPAKIRDYVSLHLENRAKKIISIHLSEITEYLKELAKGEISSDDLEYNVAVVHNRIIKKLYAADCGISQVEEQVHQIRIFIQNYLETFNPFK